MPPTSEEYFKKKEKLEPSSNFLRNNISFCDDNVILRYNILKAYQA